MLGPMEVLQKIARRVMNDNDSSGGSRGQSPPGNASPDRPGKSQQDQIDSTKKFARMAVQPQGPHPQPAPWIVDRNEMVTHVRNSTFIAIGCVARKAAMQPPQVLRRTQDNAKSAEDGVDTDSEGKKKKGQKGASWKEEQVELDHPLVKLFEHINAFHTLYDYIFYTVGWRLATGDSFAWKARNGFGLPAELWPLPSQWCHAVPSETKFIESYKVEGVWGKPVYWPTKDIIHISDPNLDWRGSGRFYGRPTMAAAGSMIDIEESMLKRMNHWFANYSPPGMVFSGAEGIGSEQIWELYHTLAQQHAMNEHSGRPFVVPEGFELETGAMTGPKEIDYSTQLMTALEWILAIFGVPKAVAGLVKDFNRANFGAAMAAFAENTVNPILEHLSQHHTVDLGHEFDENIIIRFPPITPDDTEQMRKNYETAAKTGAATPNEVREALLELPAYETGGDRPMVPATQTQAEFGNVDEGEIEAEKEEKKAEAAEQFEEQKRQFDVTAAMKGGDPKSAGMPNEGKAKGGKDALPPSGGKKPPSGSGNGKPKKKPFAKQVEDLDERDAETYELVKSMLERRSVLEERLAEDGGADHNPWPEILSKAGTTINLEPHIYVQAQATKPPDVYVKAGDVKVDVPPPQINNEVSVEAAEVQKQAAPVVNVAAPVVKVEPRIDVPASKPPDVHVAAPAAPNVEVKPVVKVEPANVTVNVPEPKPKKVKFNRDKEGRPSSATITSE